MYIGSDRGTKFRRQLNVKWALFAILWLVGGWIVLVWMSQNPAWHKVMKPLGWIVALGTFGLMILASAFGKEPRDPHDERATRRRSHITAKLFFSGLALANLPFFVQEQRREHRLLTHGIKTVATVRKEHLCGTSRRAPCVDYAFQTTSPDGKTRTYGGTAYTGQEKLGSNSTGSAIEVFYEPDDPSNSLPGPVYLERGGWPGIISALTLDLIILAVGILLALSAVSDLRDHFAEPKHVVLSHRPRE